MLPKHPFIGCRRCIPRDVRERLKLQWRLGLLESHFYGNTCGLNFSPFLYGILFQLCSCAICLSGNEVTVLKIGGNLEPANVSVYPKDSGQRSIRATFPPSWRFRQAFKGIKTPLGSIVTTLPETT